MGRKLVCGEFFLVGITADGELRRYEGVEIDGIETDKLGRVVIEKGD